MERALIPTGMGRIHSLDMLRGLAAFGVVFNHWKHFTYQTVESAAYADRTSSTAYSLFRPFYEFGWVAVDLFFCISGFIFAYYFWDKISSGKLKAWNFFAQRISRLWPLFLITTLFVAIVQYINVSQFGETIVYGNFDLKHFFMNTLMVSAWGFEAGPSFNGPSWSVSVEMLLYVLFFLFVISFKNSKWNLGLLLISIFVGLVIYVTISSYIGRGIISFFLGMMLVNIGQKIKISKPSMIFGITLIASWVLVFYEGYTGHIGGLVSSNIQQIISVNLDHAKMMTGLIMRALLIFIVFPVTIVGLVTMESRGKLPGMEKWGWLGDVSYPVYLIHFPIQILLITLARYDLINIDFNTGVFMVAFFVVLTLLSLISVYKFEKPAQNYIRAKTKRN